MATGLVQPSSKKSFRIEDLLCQSKSDKPPANEPPLPGTTLCSSNSLELKSPNLVKCDSSVIDLKTHKTSDSPSQSSCDRISSTSHMASHEATSSSSSWGDASSAFTRHLPKKRHFYSSESEQSKHLKELSPSLPSSSSGASSNSSTPSSSPSGFLGPPLFATSESPKSSNPLFSNQVSSRFQDYLHHFGASHNNTRPSDPSSQFPYLHFSPLAGSSFNPSTAFRPFLPVEHFSGEELGAIRNFTHHAAASGIYAASMAYLGSNSNAFPLTTFLSLGSGGSKRKGGQIRFTSYQTSQLEKSFKNQKYLNANDRKALANSLALSDRQVKTWFQNRRAKWRKSRDTDQGDYEDGTVSPLSDRSYSPDPGHCDSSAAANIDANTN